MSVKRTVVLGVIALAALTGCATGPRVVASDPAWATDAGGSASPSYNASEEQTCATNDGWYDVAAGACETSAP
jgi:hypothetical protein